MAKPSEQFSDFLDNAARKEDVAKLFNKLVEFVKKAKEQLTETTTEHKEELRQIVQDLATELGTSKETITKRQDDDKQTMYSESRTLLRLLEQEVSRVEGLIEYYDDADVRSEIEAVRAAIPVLPEQFDPSDILTTHAAISEAIDTLTKRIEELERRPVVRGGGGTSAAGVAQAFKYIARTEEPVGDLDGVNTTYTVSAPIFFVLNFSINSAVITQLPNYTIKNRTITFATPLPADYAGTDFEIKYIAA